MLLLVVLPQCLCSQSFETIIEDKDVPFFSSIAFQDSLTGWAVGWGGTIYKFDHGKWGKFRSPVKSTLNKIFIDSFGNGWIVGEQGTLLKLVNNEWVKIPLDTEAGLNDIYYNRDYGYLVGNAGTLYRCFDNRWVRIKSGTRHHLYGINTPEKGKGFILGQNRVIIKMEGDNLRYVRQEEISGMNHPYYYFYSSQFINKNEGYLFGQGIVHFKDNEYRVLKDANPPIIIDSKINGSEIWLINYTNVHLLSGNKLTEIKDGYYQDFKSISFSSSNVGWIAAEGGLIIKFKK